MKYKVGDKVRIKSIDWYNENKDKDDNVPLIETTNSDYNFIEVMRGFCGKVMTIFSVNGYYYDMLEDDGDYYWTDEMIEGLAGEESEKKLSDESWKPSKEEMDVLYGLAYITNQYDEHKEEIITRLYQDLKREFFNGSSYENMFPDTEDDVRRRSTIQVLEYARSLDNYNQYGKEDIDKNIAWLEKQDKKPQGKSAPEAINEKNIDSQNYLKSTNKVEPKFHVGESFNLPQGYQFVDENGNIINAQKIVLEKKKKDVNLTQEQIKKMVHDSCVLFCKHCGCGIPRDTCTSLGTCKEHDEYRSAIRTHLMEKNKKEYPKTYKECCEVLDWNHRDYDRVGYESELLCKFQVLLLCRDAYWKIAGDWIPEFRFGKKKYCIMTKDNNVISATVEETNRILTFPTEEMRDAFYENFKELIEQCKELL